MLDHIAFTIFLTGNLASLDYKTVEEPLLVIYYLNHHISTTAAEVGSFLAGQNNDGMLIFKKWEILINLSI